MNPGDKELRRHNRKESGQKFTVERMVEVLKTLDPEADVGRITAEAELVMSRLNEVKVVAGQSAWSFYGAVIVPLDLDGQGYDAFAVTDGVTAGLAAVVAGTVLATIAIKADDEAALAATADAVKCAAVNSDDPDEFVRRLVARITLDDSDQAQEKNEPQ